MMVEIKTDFTPYHISRQKFNCMHMVRQAWEWYFVRCRICIISIKHALCVYIYILHIIHHTQTLSLYFKLSMDKRDSALLSDPVVVVVAGASTYTLPVLVI